MRSSSVIDMSDLLRKSVNGHPSAVLHNHTLKSRPRPIPVAIPEQDDYSSSSDSSASSSAGSVDTVRPSSREHEAPPTHWTQYFEQELYLEQTTGEQEARYHVYLSPPINNKKGPLFVCHHGAGVSGLSFAVFAKELRSRLPDAGILSLEARMHGLSTVTSVTSGEEIIDFSLDTLANDAVSMIELTMANQGWTSLPPCVLVGHSLGGAVVTQIASSSIHVKALGTSLIGYCVIDVVEGSAMEALTFMNAYLSSRPSIFSSVEEAVTWHVRSRTLRNQRSAEASVPSLLISSPTGNRKLIWRTNLHKTIDWWDDWFTGMSKKFISGRGAKMLILAGTDRLDKELMIGQMQGKFQLVVIPEAGHFVQEDLPEKTAGLLVEFFRRNDRSQLVLPPKVSDMIAQGKKV